LIYSFANVLFRFLYPHYRRSDHRAHPVLYFPFLGWQLLHAGRRQRRAMAELHRVLQKGGDFYVFPMQLDHDFQIQAYSPFDGMDQAIGYIVESFARCAPSETKLLVKVHPWDPGFVNWRRCVRRWARKYGIERRVLYFHGGSLERMAQRSRGMVTVNSTSGIQALRHGTSLICLGEAIFDTPGLTFQHGLDRFWREAPPPSAELFDAFERLLAGSILLKGVFYSEPGLTAAVRSAVERLLDPDSFQFTGQAGEAPPSGEASAR
jgi:capsular polysaccharide export protein